MNRYKFYIHQVGMSIPIHKTFETDNPVGLVSKALDNGGFFVHYDCDDIGICVPKERIDYIEWSRVNENLEG